MNPTQRLEEVVTRLTPEQYARLLFYAESLAAAHEDTSKAFPETLRQRLRELTSKSETETLTVAERAEYIVLAEQLEDADAARLEAAARLSQEDSIPLAQALARLDAGVKGSG